MARLILRGDDAGSSKSANLAIFEACTQGALRNVSVMIAAPEAEHAASLLADLDHVCFGLHVTLNSEWDTPRWGPVLGAAVPSLTEPDGTFTRFPQVLRNRGFELHEAQQEIEAQLARGRELGFRFAYQDAHMGVGWVGLDPFLAEFRARHGLLSGDGYPHVHLPKGEDPIPAVLAQVAESDQDLVWVMHPCLDSGESRALFHEGLTPGQVAVERDRERQWLLDPRFNQITVRRFDE